MKMKRMSSLFCAVAFFGTASVAMAGAYGEPEQAEEMPRSAPATAEAAPSDDFSPFAYVAVGGLYGQEFFTGHAKQHDFSYGWGVNGRAGYRFIPNLAAELLFEDVVEFDADGEGVGANRRSTDRSAWSLMPNAKVFLVEGFCEPYLSVGAGLMHANNGHNIQQNSPGGILNQGGVGDGYAFAARFGGGMDFYMTQQIFLETEVAYVVPTGAASNYQHLTASVGFGYAFN